MVFSSTLFIFFFLPAVLLLYFAVPRQLKNGVLFVMSLVFYAWGEPIYLLIMLFSTVFDYVNGLLIERFHQNQRRVAAKVVLIGSVVINLGILGFFKYSHFLLENVNAVLGMSWSMPAVALPLGISFYTFQTMSYTIDVYRQKVHAQRNIITFGAYIAMFPQLVAGPIVQYKDIEDQLNDRRVTPDGFVCGVRRFIVGLAKKVLLANTIGLVWEQISGGSLMELSVGEAWIGALAFAFQIYFDFSGYSDMAIGLGGMLGFRFRENFNHPYRAASITDFWRRWHISLGAWFRDYVYIPLGGNRRGRGRQLLNIAIVWCLTGLWHGASWNFVIWGAYFAVLLMAEKLFLGTFLQKHQVFGHIYTLLLVAVSWVIFAVDDLPGVGAYLQAMFGLNGAGLASPAAGYYLVAHAALWIACAVFSVWQAGKWLATAHSGVQTVAAGAVYAMLFLVSVSFLVGDAYNPFLYFRF